MVDTTTEVDEEAIKAKIQLVHAFLESHSDKPVSAKELNARLEEVMPYLDIAALHVPGGANCLATWKEAYELTKGVGGDVNYHYYNWFSEPRILNLVGGRKTAGGFDRCYTSDEMTDITLELKNHRLGERIAANLVSIISSGWKNNVRKDDQYLEQFYRHLQVCTGCRNSFNSLQDY